MVCAFGWLIYWVRKIKERREEDATCKLVDALEKVRREIEKRKKEEQKAMVRLRGTDSAKVIRVIETQALRGQGTEEDQCRIVRQYWDLDGKLLAESDPGIKETE